MIDRADAGDDLFILDRLSARFVDLAKADRRARFGRGIDFDGNRSQREPTLPLPISAYGHLHPRSSSHDTNPGEAGAVAFEDRTLRRRGAEGRADCAVGWGGGHGLVYAGP